jgi:epoxyqueuosine reductase
MVDRLLTERVRAEMLNAGMDLVGFGPVERWQNAPYLLSPQAILPEAKTVIVGAVYILDTWIELGGEPTPQDHGPGGWMDQNALLDRTAYRMARLLSDAGHAAIAVASSNIWRYREYEGIPSLFAPDLSHIHAAVAAGLGEIGWSGLALTPEFGNRCRFITIVTAAELTPTPMYDGPALCDRCGDCIRHCPSGAMKGDLNSRAPHVVEIGGKTYKYLNKNMWRCAWAEHFNLDLSSTTLTDKTHIDEATILAELEAQGVRGHERGVCQKVCVPPHLRTDRPSFGRPDKLIAQNRINRRYPESMPSLRKMRDDILAKAVELGMELAVVEAIPEDTDFGRQAQREVPGVQTVLAVAFRVPPEARQIPLPQKSHEVYQYAVNQKMHQAQLRLARMIEEYGYSACVYTGSAAGYNDMVTDAELPADAVQPPTGVCQECAICHARCPMTALSVQEGILSLDGISIAYPLVDRIRCDWAKRYSLHPDEGPALIGTQTPLPPPNGAITIGDIAAGCAAKDPVMKHRTCIIEPCLRHCPAGYGGQARATIDGP